jgi:hypothetical protein
MDRPLVELAMSGGQMQGKTAHQLDFSQYLD